MIKNLHFLIVYRVKHKKKKKGILFCYLLFIYFFSKNIRPDWKKERQTNQETFGHSAVRSLAFRRNRGSSTSGFRLYNNNIKNRSFNYRSGPISNYQGSGNYSNYNSYINNNYNQQKNRHYPTQRFNNGAGLDVDNGMNNYRRRTVGSRLRAF